MRPLYLLVAVVAVAAVGRALVDYVETWSRVSFDIGNASSSPQTCEQIYRTVPMADPALRAEIMRVCEARRALGGRWVLVEATKAWVAGVWFCETLHCSEYVWPWLDRLGGSLYLAAIAAFLAVVCFVYTSLQLAGQFALEYGRHRLMGRGHYPPGYGRGYGGYEVRFGPGEYEVELERPPARAISAPFPR